VTEVNVQLSRLHSHCVERLEIICIVIIIVDAVEGS